MDGTSNSFVAATPVQDLRFRANDLRADAKLAARPDASSPAVLGVVITQAQAQQVA
jgi:hypothetical protein